MGQEPGQNVSEASSLDWSRRLNQFYEVCLLTQDLINLCVGCPEAGSQAQDELPRQQQKHGDLESSVGALPPHPHTTCLWQALAALETLS